MIYNQIRSDIGEILRKLCEYKGIEIIEGLSLIHIFAFSTNTFQYFE